MKTALAITLLTASTAGATVAAYGPRVGYTHDDAFDQVHFGGQVWIVDLINANIDLVPSLELGLGDDATVLAINGDVVYEFTELAQGAWGFYAGAGLAFNRWDIGDAGNGEIGLNILGGATWDLPAGDKELFGELRLGLEDSPGLKLTFGLNFF